MAEYIDREALFAEFDRLGLGEHSIVEKVFSIGVRTIIAGMPAADVAPVTHGRCPICSGRKILTQDCDNGYSVEVDAEQGEMSIWQGDTCLTVISIDYCPNCGAKMDGGGSDAVD